MASGRDEEVVRIAETFGEVARTLLADHDTETTLDTIVRLAVDSLEACEFAGISLIEGRRITSPAHTNEIPRILDEIQSEVDEGPCLDAIREHQVFLVGDLVADQRWPRFAARAREATGVSSILSLRLFAEQNTMGSLNLYATRPHAFGTTDVALAAVFATHAAVAMSSAHREELLERKAATRDLIGRAKGILMAREHVTDDEAFDLLRRSSQHQNIKLTEVAEQVNLTGEPPALPTTT